ncbi:SDR family oxidoreductase [bacterium]|nr:SDR family oxidoreductase [bacterium]
MSKGAVVITGASTGIGNACARMLDDAGFRVFAGVRKQEDADRISAQGSDRLTPLICDITDTDSLARAAEEVAAEMGEAGLAGLVFNNAGIAVTGDARDLELAHWRRVVEVNLMGVVHGSHAAYRLMAAQGSGHIVNIASLAGLVPFPSNVPYSTTKHAVVGLSRSLRIEGEDLGVRVSVVCPGFVESNIYAAAEAVNLPADDLARDIPFRKVPAEAAARRILDGVLRNEAVIVFPGYARLSWALDRINQRLGLPLARRLIRDLRKLRQVKEVS